MQPVASSPRPASRDTSQPSPLTTSSLAWTSCAPASLLLEERRQTAVFLALRVGRHTTLSNIQENTFEPAILPSPCHDASSPPAFHHPGSVDGKVDLSWPGTPSRLSPAPACPAARKRPNAEGAPSRPAAGDDEFPRGVTRPAHAGSLNVQGLRWFALDDRTK